MGRIVTVILAVVSMLPAALGAQGAARCTGRVVDGSSKPVAGARVSLYTAAADVELGDLSFVAEAMTDADGRFSLACPAEAKPGEIGEIVADKEGLAITWATVLLSGPRELTLTLAKPAEFSGTVVDEAGNPVAAAEVRAYLVRSDSEGPQSICGGGDFRELVTVTDARGAFAFRRVPPDTVGEFVVRAAGKAPVFTMREGEVPMPFKYGAGAKDIRITLPDGAVIEGKVVDKGTDDGVSGVMVRALIEEGPSAIGPIYAASGGDGTFRLEGLGEGAYTLSAVAAPGKGELLAPELAVATKKGSTEQGVRLEVERMSLLEVKFTDGQSGAQVMSAGVRVASTDGSWSKTAISRNGQLKVRLTPGDYQIVEMRATGYRSLDIIDDIIHVPAGETKTVSYALEPEPKITGTVRDESGVPVEGAEVTFWAGRTIVVTKTDKDGRFEGPSSMYGFASAFMPTFVIRHAQRNLAAVVEPEDATKPVEVTLKNAWTVRGRVVGVDGKPIAGADASLALHAKRQGGTFQPGIKADGEGWYEVTALPANLKYDIDVHARGYGADEVVFELGEAAGEVFPVKDIVLLVADKSISGTVVDSAGRPVTVSVEVTGKGQAIQAVSTDSEGKFKIDGLVEGAVTLTAKGRLVGGSGAIKVEAQAGAEDVKIVVPVPEGTEPESLVGKALPDLKALGADDTAWAAAVDSAKDRAILVIFGDETQRSSRHMVQILRDRAGALRDKGVAVFRVDVSDRKPEEKVPGKPDSAFPTKWVTEKGDEIKFGWGIRALPWLILTDKEHVVRAEGFGADEVDAKLAQVQN